MSISCCGCARVIAVEMLHDGGTGLARCGALGGRGRHGRWEWRVLSWWRAGLRLDGRALLLRRPRAGVPLEGAGPLLLFPGSEQVPLLLDLWHAGDQHCVELRHDAALLAPRQRGRHRLERHHVWPAHHRDRRPVRRVVRRRRRRRRHPGGERRRRRLVRHRRLCVLLRDRGRRGVPLLRLQVLHALHALLQHLRLLPAAPQLDLPQPLRHLNHLVTRLQLHSVPEVLPPQRRCRLRQVRGFHASAALAHPGHALMWGATAPGGKGQVARRFGAHEVRAPARQRLAR
mmetsp:Transcript_26919/g.67727  ORF Transcript_26919/g.67727 Transcript_26919/m.67727 type:complete len:287 (-) Transcript_26919:108-968(-)